MIRTQNRKETLARLRSQPDVPVLIVGGGINGIGTFRDLAMQGIGALLVEKDDFCSGASAASSHMVHGGIRYLENGEFRLVREAVRERNRLIQNAPHAVRPLPTVIPIFSWLSGLLNAPLKFLGLLNQPAERGAAVIKIGLLLYDAYTRPQATVPGHGFDLRPRVLERFPALNPAVRCAATYYDAFMPAPERLCIDLLTDALEANPGASALNYCQAVSSAAEGVRIKEAISGEELLVRPRVVVNAAGPWIDRTNAALGAETRFIGGTKGSHLVLDAPVLLEAIGGHEFFFENDDGRIVLICPFEDRVLVGTSDIPWEDPDEANCTDAEVEYFLSMIEKIFPGLRPAESEIVFRFSGVRPLPAAEARTSGQISRDHSIEEVSPGERRPFTTLSLIGGKWTTFRAFSEEAVDRCLELLGQKRLRTTRETPIGGGAGFPKTPTNRQEWISRMSARSGLTPDRLNTLLERYGTRAETYTSQLTGKKENFLKGSTDFSEEEIRMLAAQEMVVRLDDLLLRRTLLGMLGKLNRTVVEAIAEQAAKELGWQEAEKRAEIERSLKILKRNHGVSL